MMAAGIRRSGRPPVAVLLVAASCWGARAEPPLPASLYECRTIVTGTDLRDRPAGFARCFLEVLVKVTGNPALHANPDAVAASQQAQTMVAGFSYRDRMTGLSRHDDQGSSDRPQDLTVGFDPARIDAVLASLGERPWAGERPRLDLTVALRPAGLRLAPADQDDLLARARAALANAAVRYGMALSSSESVTLASAAPPPGAEPAGTVSLRGTLVWSDVENGWAGAWAMARGDREPRWDIKGASLDAAFRDAVLGAMAVLSGHPEMPQAWAEAALK